MESPESDSRFPTWTAALSRRETSPPITTQSAFGMLILYTTLYVLPLYISPSSRPSRTLTRDAPVVIRARIRSVTVSCVVCTGITLYFLLYHSSPTGGLETPSTTEEGRGNVSLQDALHALGLWPLGLWETLNSVSLTAILFVGPLFRYFVCGDGIYEWLSLEPVKDVLNEITVFRNIVAGPLTEELLFRSSALPYLLLSPFCSSPSPPSSSPLTSPLFFFSSPLIFGLAHLNHFYERRLTHPQVPLPTACLITVFQLTYTTLFGAFATFVAMRTGSLAAAVAVHAFCNCMGFPMVGGVVEGPLMGGGGGGEGRPLGPNWLWTTIYHALLVVGGTAFWKGLWLWTESENRLI
ncbi:CaaX protease [Zalerion maritima]|uniref:intramembrane prenyl-peptidase Rce1 n=1 Tax=Zalerion maritima TaxID=339359 RepID=A0AAD5RMM9_9PEZI|nr:CaaX protease [Zalerion maritima]